MMTEPRVMRMRKMVTDTNIADTTTKVTTPVQTKVMMTGLKRTFQRKIPKTQMKVTRRRLTTPLTKFMGQKIQGTNVVQILNLLKKTTTTTTTTTKTKTQNLPEAYRHKQECDHPIIIQWLVLWRQVALFPNFLSLLIRKRQILWLLKHFQGIS